MTCLNPKASFDRVSLAENAGSVVRIKRQFEGRGAFQQLNDHVKHQMPEELLDQTEPSRLNQNQRERITKKKRTDGHCSCRSLLSDLRVENVPPYCGNSSSRIELSDSTGTHEQIRPQDSELLGRYFR